MDLVIRAVVAFFFILLLTRIVGRRELTKAVTTQVNEAKERFDPPVRHVAVH